MRIAKEGQRWVTPGFILQRAVLGVDQKPPLRIGFTVTKKTDKLAVHRNRMKRRLRALAGSILICDEKKGYDYIFIARRDCLTLPFAQMKKDLIWALGKLEQL